MLAYACNAWECWHSAAQDRADLTLDANKRFSVPMGAGMLLCKDNDLLGGTFRVTPVTCQRDSHLDFCGRIRTGEEATYACHRD